MTKPIIEVSEREFGLARVELLETWEQLQAARERFLAAVKADHALPAWCDGQRGTRAARAAAIATFGDFFYYGEESPKSVQRLIGLIGASPATIQLAGTLNEAKRTFASSMSRLQHCMWIDDRRERHPLVRSAFRQLKIPRINTLHATRQVAIVAPGVIRLSWCISRKSRIKQVTREEAIRYIRESPSRQQRFAQALIRLERLAPQTLLARYRSGDPLAIANATYPTQGGPMKNRQYTSGMPLLIGLAPGEALPECCPPRRGERPRRRRPSNIEPVAFIRALKIHRYRAPPRRLRNASAERSLEQLFRGP